MSCQRSENETTAAALVRSSVDLRTAFCPGGFKPSCMLPTFLSFLPSFQHPDDNNRQPSKHDEQRRTDERAVQSSITGRTRRRRRAAAAATATYQGVTHVLGGGGRQTAAAGCRQLLSRGSIGRSGRRSGRQGIKKKKKPEAGRRHAER